MIPSDGSCAQCEYPAGFPVDCEWCGLLVHRHTGPTACSTYVNAGPDPVFRRLTCRVRVCVDCSVGDA